MDGFEIIANVIAAIGAIGALGTASFGLVDASKAFWGGISNVGFGHILNGCEPFFGLLRRATGPEDWKWLLRAQWRNGRDKEAQKALVRSLVRLGLTQGAVEELSDIANVTPEELKYLVAKLRDGAELDGSDINILGRIDQAIGYRIDAAYERADQQYRNVARVCAGLVSIALAIFVGLLWYNEEVRSLVAAAAKPGADTAVQAAAAAAQKTSYLSSDMVWAALLAGVLAVPIAPIAKDLMSALTAAMGAVKATRSVR